MEGTHLDKSLKAIQRVRLFKKERKGATVYGAMSAMSDLNRDQIERAWKNA